MSKKILLLGLIMMTIIFITGCCVTIIPATGLATVDEIDFLTLELFPVQIFVIARGNLPDPCTEIYEVLQEREGDTFFITIKTYRSPGFCIQAVSYTHLTLPTKRIV